METIEMAKQLINPEDYMCWNLKDAYFIVPIHGDDRKFLRFIWRERRYEFVPFWV